MPRKPATTNDAHATLTLSISYDQARLADILEAAKEVIEKATEQGKVDGYLDLHRVGRIPADDLRD